MTNRIFLLIILFSLSISYGQLRNPKNIPFNWKTDTTKNDIDLSELMVVLPRGSFQVLNYPKFIRKEIGLKSFFQKNLLCYWKLMERQKPIP